MTRMLPARIRASTNSGEKIMFGLIRDAARSDDLVCLYSVGLARHERKDYAEADLVIVAPSGIYCIEVKGGDVERRSGEWRVSKGGRSYTSLEGPFKQAQSSRWPLLKYLDRRLGRQLRQDCIIGWGVAFPDIRFLQEDPEWDLEVVYDCRDTARSFVLYIERLERYFTKRRVETGRSQPKGLSLKDRNDVVQALRGDFEVVPSLSGLLSDSERDLISLSSDQHRILDYALNRSNPRILCDGPAGTGKTLIALEAARRLADSGLSVLVLCYNDNLSRFLKHDFATDSTKIRVTTLHAFLRDFIERAGLRGHLSSEEQLLEASTLFNESYPALFETACSILLEEHVLPQFDAIIIDEAQDILTPAFLNCLDLVLSGGFRNGRWLIFLDSKMQAGLYDRVDSVLIDQLRTFNAASFNLVENFRNPLEIAHEACAIAGA